MTGFIYLATPYSKYAPSLSPLALELAYQMACCARATLIRAGVPCFSPIAHSHGPAIYGDLDPLDHAIWLPAEKPLRDRAAGLCIYHAEGWRGSYGIERERCRRARRARPCDDLEMEISPFADRGDAGSRA